MSSIGLTTRVLNEAMLARLTSEDWGLCGEAEQAMNDYTRVRMLEDDFLRRILPPVSITNDEFDRQVDTDTPVRVTDLEPDVPLQPLPENRYKHGLRYRVMFDRIMAPRFNRSVEELRNYDMDLRDVLTRNAIMASQVELRKRGYRTLREIRMAKHGA